MNVLRDELVGKSLEVVESANKDLEGLRGEIVDETRNTFQVEADEVKTVLKEGNTFRIDGEVVEGDDLLSRPEDRVKR